MLLYYGVSKQSYVFTYAFGRFYRYYCAVDVRQNEGDGQVIRLTKKIENEYQSVGAQNHSRDWFYRTSNHIQHTFDLIWLSWIFTGFFQTFGYEYNYDIDNRPAVFASCTQDGRLTSGDCRIYLEHAQTTTDCLTELTLMYDAHRTKGITGPRADFRCKYIRFKTFFLTIYSRPTDVIN